MVKGVVMDIKDGKQAVVLDANGRFRVIANDRFHIGQTVEVHKVSRFVRPKDCKKANTILVCAGAVATAMSIFAIIHSSSKR